jgi:putative NADH-flavin reductase
VRIALVGAPCGAGREFIRQACAAGHEVIAPVRDPARVTEAYPRPRGVPADVMDSAAIRPAVEGSDAVVSARMVPSASSTRCMSRASVGSSWSAYAPERMFLASVND